MRELITYNQTEFWRHSIGYCMKKDGDVCLVSDQEEYPVFGTNLTYSLNEYVHFHQKSGTAGRPLKIFDTQESWNWVSS